MTGRGPTERGATERGRTTDPAAIARARADAVLDAAAAGDRLVVRAHDRTPGATGAVDALGDLVARDAEHVTIATRRGAVTIARADVVAAKPVPPPPAPRRAAPPPPGTPT